jgi:hypothetical protein
MTRKIGAESTPPPNGHKMTNDSFKDIEKLEADLWEAADNLRANSKLTSSDYFMPVLGVIFLRHAAHNDAPPTRKGVYGDCLVKCGSAFESVLKVLCTQNGWKFDPKDTAARLLGTVLPHTKLDGFFKEPLTLIATMRNRLSAAHGGGAAVRSVERHVAQYAITSTAAAMVLLVHAVEF